MVPLSSWSTDFAFNFQKYEAKIVKYYKYLLIQLQSYSEFIYFVCTVKGTWELDNLWHIKYIGIVQY